MNDTNSRYFFQYSEPSKFNIYNLIRNFLNYLLGDKRYCYPRVFLVYPYSFVVGIHYAVF